MKEELRKPYSKLKIENNRDEMNKNDKNKKSETSYYVGRESRSRQLNQRFQRSNSKPGFSGLNQAINISDITPEILPSKT